MALIPIRASGTFGNVDDSHTYTLEVRKAGYSGGVTTLRLNNVILEYLGGDANAYDPIKASRLSFSFAVRTDAEKSFFSELENSELFSFGVTLKEDGVIQWRGWIYPEQIRRPIRYNGLASAQAGDALALLKYSDDIPSRLSLPGIIASMIRDNNQDRTGFYFNRLYDNGDEVLRSNLSWVDIWFSQYFKAHIWSITHRLNITDFGNYIKIILQSYACRIFQGEGGVYWVDHIPERYLGTSDFKRYNYDTGLSVGTIEPTGTGVTSVDMEVEIDRVYSSGSVYRTQPIYNRINFYLVSNAPADTFAFSAASAIATSNNSIDIGDEYTNNSSTFQVVFIPGYLSDQQRQLYEIRQDDTIWMQRTSGTNDPLSKGTLTKSSGSGPSSIDYSSYRNADRTVVADLSEDLSVDSFYTKDVPFQEVLSYTPPAAIADSSDINTFEYGGFNGVSQNVAVQGTITPPQSFGTALRRSMFDDWDLISGGDFQNGDESNWSSYNGMTATTPAADGTMRLTRNSTGATDESVYQAITTESGEDYFVIIEITNAVPDADTGRWLIGADTGNTITWGSNLGEVATTRDDQEYLYFEFTASGTTSYIHIGATGGTAGDYADFSNCKVVKKSNLQKVENLLIDEFVHHYSVQRKLYNLTFRSSAKFNDTIVFGDDIMIPNNFRFSPRYKEISGEFISIANDDYIYWDTASFGGLSNNGQSNNLITNIGTANQYFESQQSLKGGYFDLEFYTTDNTAGAGNDTEIEIGLENTGTGSGTIKSLDHSWYLLNDVSESQKQIYVYEDGVQRYVEDYTFDSSDKFNIRYNGNKIEFLLNDVVKYTSFVSPSFDLSARIYLASDQEFGVQKVKLRGQAMKGTYQQ